MGAGSTGIEIRGSAKFPICLNDASHAWRTPERGLRARRDLLPALERQEIERVGRKLATERGLAFDAIEDGQAIRGKLIGSAQLVSGRFAMVDGGLGFSLVAVGDREGGRPGGHRHHVRR
jgi:Protein of unknown function (DUF3363)